MNFKSITGALSAALFAILLAASPAGSGSMTLLGAGKPGAAAITFSLTYQSTANDTVGGTTINYGSLSCGAADTNRVVAVGVWTRGGGNVSSMTIGGNPANQVSGAAAANPSTTFSDIWYLSVPTGANCSISVTYAAATFQSIIWVYRIVTSTPTPSAGANASDASLQNISTTLTVPSGGGAMNAYGSRNQTFGSWTNAVADDTQSLSGHGVSAATTTGTGSVTVTAAVAGSGGENALSSAAWGP